MRCAKYGMSALFVLWSMSVSFGQEGLLKCEISADTISKGMIIKIVYSAENLEGSFEIPDFENFKIIGGPLRSKSRNIINGVKTTEETVIFKMRAKKVGNLYIEPVFFVNARKTYEIPPVKIVVYDDYESVRGSTELKLIWSSEAIRDIDSAESNSKKRVFKRI